jgi:uncharacterized protein YndB with AHSA1/START domain
VAKGVDVTVLETAIEIAAPPDRVWRVLGTLDALERYDPGVTRSQITSDARTGIGATRRCDLKPGGWFRERVTVWEPACSLGFELVDCTLPVKRLRHDYTLTSMEGGTRVQQRMEYRLKFGPLGSLLDAAIVRRRWRAGVTLFLRGLKQLAERGPDTVGL